MKVAFSEIFGRKINLNEIDDDWFPHEDINIETPVVGFITIRRIADAEAVVSGELSGAAQSPCDRCGKATHVDLSSEFSYECVVGKEDIQPHHEVECREEDFIKIYLEEPVVSIGDILREQVLLAVPASVLCKQSCKGLCYHCGTDLNTGTCTCEVGNTTSPFASLKQIKGK